MNHRPGIDPASELTGDGQNLRASDAVFLKMGSTRSLYAQTLLELIEEGKPIAFVEADLMGASGTSSVMERYPDRCVQVGVAEQNAIGVAAGLADMGLTAFVSTFGVLISRRACDQVWMAVCFNNKNVKLNGMDPGFMAETNGVTHQALEDVAILRSFPNMVILEPADCKEVVEAMRIAAEYVGPVYIRSVRSEMPLICEEAEPPFELGKAVILRPGNDVSIIASGVMVPFALRAHDVLRTEGVQARVVNPRTIKPLDEEMIVRCAKDTGAIVTVENHSVIGGLGGAIAELLAETWPTPMKRIGVRNKFGNAGTFEYLVRLYGMDVEDIVAAAKELLARKTTTS